MKDLITERDWHDAQGLPQALIYKHSPICSLSARSLPEIKKVEKSRPDVPVYLVDVVGRRPLSQRIARELGVRHESPQVIVLVNGTPRWDASHMGVTATEVLEALPD